MSFFGNPAISQAAAALSQANAQNAALQPTTASGMTIAQYANMAAPLAGGTSVFFNPNATVTTNYPGPWVTFTPAPPVFSNPRERIAYDVITRGGDPATMARNIVAMIDAMHLQEAFDLSQTLKVAP